VRNPAVLDFVELFRGGWTGSYLVMPYRHHHLGASSGANAKQRKRRMEVVIAFVLWVLGAARAALVLCDHFKKPFRSTSG